MTTAAAAAQYLAEHQASLRGRALAISNPHGKPIEELPVIYGFANTNSPGWIDAVAIAQDGTCLGRHLCSAEGYIWHDLGLLEGTRPDRHEIYAKYYPDGYRMEFVGHDEASAHQGLLAAIDLNKKAGEAAAAAKAEAEAKGAEA